MAKRETNMSILCCSNCGMRVIATSAGLCPSCRYNLSGSNFDAQVVPRFVYESAEKEAQNPLSMPTHFDLIWILFSLRGRLSLGMMWIAAALSTILWVALYCWDQFVQIIPPSWPLHS